MALLRCGRIVNLFGRTNEFQNARNLSNKSAIVTKIHRKRYLKMYPTLMVQPDGSAFNFRHNEPRRIVELPLNLSQLSEEERAYYLEKRKQKKKVVVEEDLEDSFDSTQYLSFIKKN